MTPTQLQKELDARGLKQPLRAARVLGVSRFTLWRWMNGSRSITQQAEMAIRWALQKFDEKGES